MVSVLDNAAYTRSTACNYTKGAYIASHPFCKMNCPRGSTFAPGTFILNNGLDDRMKSSILQAFSEIVR